MPFTNQLLDTLTEEHDKKIALLFNEIPTSPSYLLSNMQGMAALREALNQITELAKMPSAQHIKDERGLEIATKLQRMDPHPMNPHFTQYSMAELAKISELLKNQHPDNKELASAIDRYQEAYYQAYNPLYKPTGIYQILVGAQLLMDRNIPHVYDKSPEFQSYILNNIVKPIIDIYADLETRNLQAQDVASIQFIIQVMEHNLEQFELDASDRISKIEGEDNTAKFRKLKIESEIHELRKFTSGVKKELNHICDKIIAVETHAMTKQLQGQVNKRQLRKAEKNVIKALNQDASASKKLDYILNSQFREYGEEKAQKHHGSQVMPLNQSKLPEMGSSNGLCFGYSSLFLDVCQTPNWDNLSHQEKINQLKASLAPTISEFERDKNNRLKMNLAAGLKYDTQFLSSCPEAIAKDVNADKGKNLNLAKQLSSALTAQEPPKSYLIAIYSKTGGHALSFREDINGTIWFHDSNSGLYTFDNKIDFSKFLDTYIKDTYSEYNQRFSLYNYNILQQRATNLVVPEEFKGNRAKKNPISAVPEFTNPVELQETPVVKALSESSDNVQRLRSNREPALMNQKNRQPLARMEAARFVKAIQPTDVSPVGQIINLLQVELAKVIRNSLPSDTSRDIIAPLIIELQNLDNTDKSPANKMKLAHGMLQKVEMNAMTQAGGINAVTIIHQILENQQNQNVNINKPKK